MKGMSYDSLELAGSWKPVWLRPLIITMYHSVSLEGIPAQVPSQGSGHTVSDEGLLE